MSFAVRLDSAPQRLHRRLRIALVAFALAASSFALAFAEPAARGWIALAALASFAVAFGRARPASNAGAGGRPRRRLPAWIAGTSPAGGTLWIDESGRASWSHVPGCAGDPPRPVRIERWNLIGPFAWLRLRAANAREPIDVLIARKGAGTRKADIAVDDDWRRLRAWLLWYGRGGTPADDRSGAARERQ